MANELSERWSAGGRDAEEKSRVLNEHIYYEIITALGIPNCDTSDYFAWEDMNFARLGHCRVLIEFFSGSRSKKSDHRVLEDDVLSEEYGFGPKKFKFAPDVEDRLEKDLFHLTYARLRHEGDRENKPWPDAFLIEVHKTCIRFVRRVLMGSLPDGIKLLEREKWEKLRCVIESRREVLISRPNKVWRVEMGRELESGYSTFTQIKMTGVSAGAESFIPRGNEANSPVIIVRLSQTK